MFLDVIDSQGYFYPLFFFVILEFVFPCKKGVVGKSKNFIQHSIANIQTCLINIICHTTGVHETTTDKIESDVSTAWKGLKEVSSSSMSNIAKVTLAQKLAKLQVQFLLYQKEFNVEWEMILILRFVKSSEKYIQKHN